MGLRTIRESLQAQHDAEYLGRKAARFEQVWEAWSWRLAHDPLRDAVPVPGTDPQQYLLKTPQNLQIYGIGYAITFLYTVTDEQVDILRIRVTGTV